MTIVDKFNELSFESQSLVIAEMVSQALRYVGLRLPKLSDLVTVRLLGGIGTEKQIRAAKREARTVRYLSPDSSKALASWAVMDDPYKFDFEKLLTWFQNLMCDASGKSRGETIEQCLNWVGRIITENRRGGDTEKE